jgi:uncharacterized SAM-binding protein YcdF (DUF218 family)
MFFLLSKAFWPVAAPTNALVFITAVATFWSVLRKSKWAAWLAVAGASGLLIGSFTPVGSWLLLPLENRFPQWQIDQQAAPDGIIALGGEAGERIAALAQLSRRFPQARLVYSGPGEWTPDTDKLLSIFVRLGGDPARITMETRSRNTFENAVYSRELIKPNPVERWLLITSAVHMPRAVGCFRLAGFRIEAFPIEFITGDGLHAPPPFDAGSKALSKLDTAMREWIGLVVYRLTGKTEALFPAP